VLIDAILLTQVRVNLLHDHGDDALALIPAAAKPVAP
jgi:hypothetical protein